MILTVAKNRLLNLRRDRAGFVLAFVLPVAFFSIFALVFPSGSRSGATRKIRVAVVDEDGTPNSKRFADALEAEPLAVVRKPGREGGLGGVPYTAATAESAVRSGNVPIALIIPKGFGDQPIGFGPGARRPRVRVLSDSADPVAPQVVAGLIQKVVMASMPDVMARSGMETFDQWGGGLTPEQRARMEENLKRLREVKPQTAEPAEKGSAGGLIKVEIRDVVGEKKKNPVIASFAAGLGVLFLLFSAAGAGGALIEEAESGTLDRILATRVSMTQLLSGKLLYLAALAFTQLTLMFVWGAIFFGLELVNHLPGFFVMAVVSSLAASTFGLMLAAICRSRMQLVALSNLSILLMSALGGSMFPRFLMPERMQKIGLITINAWSLDGFQKVFWREEPLFNLWPQVAVLLGASLLFFAAARRIARRWEIA